MPFKDDLISRAMEQIAKTIHTVRGLRSQGLSDEALKQINDAYRDHTGSSAEVIHLLPSEQLLDLLSSAGYLDGEKALLVGELLLAEAELDEHSEDVAGLYLKAYDLFLEAALSDELFAETYRDKLASLDQQLGEFALPSGTQRRRFEYLATQGRFAEAEDQLFDLAELAPTPELLQRGRRFYQALESLPEEKLEAGALPKDELAEGLASFEARLEHVER